MTYDEFAEIALAMPGVEEGLSYGQPAIKRDGKMMFAPKGDYAVAVRVDWETRDRLLEEEADVFYITDHYRNWPWILARLDAMTHAQARDLVRISWEEAPKKNKLRKG